MLLLAIVDVFSVNEKEYPTKGIIIADLCPPASQQMHLVLLNVGNVRIPITDGFDIFSNPVRLDMMENERVNIFAP